MRNSSRHLPVYAPLDFAVVRAPLLTVEAYWSLAGGEDQVRLLADPRVRRALAVASPSLLSAIGRWQRGALTKKDADRLLARLLMYQIRMSTRPTPFGLFAGCAPAGWAEEGDLRVNQSLGRTVTRPDFSWLMDLVLEAEAIPEVRRQLGFLANPLIEIRSDRALLFEATPPGTSPPVSSIRATSVVRLALDLSRSGITAASLAAALAGANPSVTPEKIDRLLTQLWGQRFLLTDLRPPLTASSPAAYVLDKLTGIPEAAELRKRLAQLLEFAADWDRPDWPNSLDTFPLMLAAAGCPDDGSKDSPIQADMALGLSGRASAAIGREAARAAELLLRLSPNPRGLANLVAYRSAFVTRYGTDREVPLNELTDPVRGLGPVSAHGGASVGPPHEKAVERSKELLRLATSALRNHQKVVELDDTTFARLETWNPAEYSAPSSIDLNVLIGAKSEKAIDAGDFNLVVGPNLGAWAAGRNFGRFAHQHPSGAELLKQIAEKEAVLSPRSFQVEVVYLPQNVRSANVAVRPAVCGYEIVFGVSAGVSPESVIHLDELVVGVEDNRFYVRWRDRDTRLRFASGHMLGHIGAPAVFQFLLQVGFDGETPLISFDWGPAEGFPFLPRVQKGRIILRPAEWRITKRSNLQFNFDFLNSWRSEWSVPPNIWLTVGDNRLLLNLDLKTHAQLLLAECGKLRENQSLLLQEVMPALDQAWLEGDEGHYYSELTVPLLLQPEALERTPLGHKPARSRAMPVPDRRAHQPGSEWLYAKLYCPADRVDELISEWVAPFVRNSLAGGLVDSWFFLRYADPGEHLRLRFHGDPRSLCDLQFGNVCRWATALIDRGLLTKIVFEAYEPEIERFGGPNGLPLSEQIFHADSEAAASLTSVLLTKEWTDPPRRILLYTLTTHDLLMSLGLDGLEAIAWYKEHARAGKEVSAEYRAAKQSLRLVLGDPDRWLSTQPGSEEISRSLSQRRRQIAPLLHKLAGLGDSAALDQPISSLAASYLHLHLNRIGGALYERKVLSFLLRSTESLSKAPLQL